MAPTPVQMFRGNSDKSNTLHRLPNLVTRSMLPTQSAAVDSEVTTSTNSFRRILEEMPSNPAQPILENAPSMGVPRPGLNDLKRIMTSPILTDIINEMPEHTILKRHGVNQNSISIPASTPSSPQVETTSVYINTMVPLGLVLISIGITLLAVSTIIFFMKARKAGKQETWEREQEGDKERRRMRFARLKHVRVELKDLGEILCIDRIV